MAKKPEFGETRQILGREAEHFAAAQSWAELEHEINQIPNFPNGGGSLNPADVLIAINEARRAHAAGQPYTLTGVPDVFGLREAVGRLLETDLTPPRSAVIAVNGLAKWIAGAQEEPKDWRRTTRDDKK